uniref:Helicase ATP-binding domain-containing protein n=1 Tax=Dunaliella tertiolecta TaxID=3047 RepID=A0A7S3QZC2_DUNTE
MGTDYDKRKGAKRAWKKVAAKGAEKALADEKTKRRDRKKRKGRRLCQGMCYKDPTITDEDLQWNGKADDAEDAAEVPSDIEDDVTAERKRSHASATSSFHANPAVQLVLEEARLEAKGSKKAKLQLLGESENDVINSNKPQQSGTEMPPGKSEQQTKAKGGKKKEEPKKKGNAGKEGVPVVRLSTGVHLLDPVAATDHANAQARAQAAARAGAEGARVMEPEALQRFPTLIQRFMVSQGFVEPTPIQATCWPPSCGGQDVLGVAEPGSGKTLAYLLPGIIKLQAAGHSNATSPANPPMLVLAPTRELALQVASTCRHVQKLTGLRTACIYGGVPKEQQVEVLQKHPHIVVATPGRLLDLIDDHALHIGPVPNSSPMQPSATSDTSARAAGSGSAPNGVAAEGGGSGGGGGETGTLYVVLDEADKMLSLGFKPQLERLRGMVLSDRAGEDIAGSEGHGGAAKKKAKKSQQQQQLQGGSRRPQVLMFTATMPQDTATAAASWLLPTAHRAIISGGSAAASISSTVTQVRGKEHQPSSAQVATVTPAQ